jgi:hypothetical protein
MYYAQVPSISLQWSCPDEQAEAQLMLWVNGYPKSILWVSKCKFHNFFLATPYALTLSLHDTVVETATLNLKN